MKKRVKFQLQIAVFAVLVLVLIFGAFVLILNGSQVGESIGTLETRVKAIEKDLGIMERVVKNDSDEDDDDSEEIFRGATEEDVVDFEEVKETTDSGQKAVETVATGDSFIRIVSPKHDDNLTKHPIVFSGVVSPNTERIVVNAFGVSNTGKSFYQVYTIKEFKYGDKKFEYTSKVEWNNLAYGTNNYKFTSYFDDGTSDSSSVTVYLLEDDEVKNPSEEKEE